MAKKNKLITNANSKGFSLDFFQSDNFSPYGISTGITPKFNPETAKKIILNDPLVKAALITLVDKTLESGWRVTGEDEKSRVKSAEEKLDELKFNPVLRKMLFNLFLYNNAFVEIVKDSNGVKDINVLETAFMKIQAEQNGDVIRYYQENLAGNYNDSPSWTPDKVTHFKLNELSSNVWADSDMQTLYDTVLIKDNIRQWLSWFFGTNQMRPWFNFKSKLSETKAKEFVSWMKRTEKDKALPFITEGDTTVAALFSFASEGKSIQDVLNWCDSQILMLLQVPPIAVGMADQSGRSNSVEQFSALHTRIKNIQEILEDSINYDLMPKLGYSKVHFDFGSLDLGVSKQVFEIVQLMKNSMFTDDAIREFLEAQNIVFETTEVFKDPVEEAMKMQEATMTNKDVGTGNEGMIGNKSADSAPSRQRQNNATNSTANKSQLVRNTFSDTKLSPSKNWVL